MEETHRTPNSRPWISWVGRALGILAILVMGSLSSGCGVTVRGVDRAFTTFRNSEMFHQGRHGELTEEELAWAKTAWSYFAKNINPGTGLVNSVDRYQTTTMWHVADSIAAMISAHELGIIDDAEFDARISSLLHSLNTIQLAFGKLPNKLYSTENRTMVDYESQKGQVGWSAVDIGRLLVWLQILRTRHPLYLEYVDKILLRWDFCEVVDDRGYLHGSRKTESGYETFQEGRLGYEEYSALGYQVHLIDTDAASEIEPSYDVHVDDFILPYDARDPRELGGFAPIVSIPHLLNGLEFNWDAVQDRNTSDRRHTDQQMAELAQKIYDVQEARFLRERVLTARTDHETSAPPHYVHDSIFSVGTPWSTMSDEGKVVNRAALVSTRATFAMWALFKTDYTDLLLRAVQHLSSDRGWFEGRFERSGGWDRTTTSSTNAVVLEALLYKETGRLDRGQNRYTHYGTVMGDEFSRPKNCLPAPFTENPR